MIERQFVMQKIKEQAIREFLAKKLSKAGYSFAEIQRTPLGEKIIIYTTRPGLVVGVKGENTRKLTAALKKKFKMENPQIEVGEVNNPYLDPHSVADRIAYVLETYGSTRFKSIGYKTLQNIIDAGALGAEIVLSGRIPSSRAKTWRFSAGYLKKSGDISENQVLRAEAIATLKIGVIGIKVSIMPPNIVLADKILLQLEKKKEELEETREADLKPTKVVEEAPKKQPKEKKTVTKEETKTKKTKETETKPKGKKATPKETKKEVKQNGNTKEK